MTPQLKWVPKTEQRAQARRFSARLQPIIAYYEQVFGVQVARVTIRQMRSRWGSCRPDTRRITLNLLLAQVPVELLEYVVIHEFVHFFARGHGKDFYQLFAQHCPDWKERREALNQYRIS